MDEELSSRIGEIARALLGEPNKRLSTRDQLRFGRNGSVAVEVGGEKAGTWYDHEKQVGGGARELLEIKGGIGPDEIPHWLKVHLGKGRERARASPRIAATYSYRDESGALLFEVARYEPKRFRQRRPDGKGGWIWRVKDCRRVLYRLPELIAAPRAATAFIVEGEKDADALARLGLVATTNPGGAGKWRSEYSSFLKGRAVAIVPDNDEAGRQHAFAVAAALARIAASVRIVELPDLAPKGDVSDWLDGGGTRERLEKLVREAPEHRAEALGRPDAEAPMIDPAAPYEVAKQMIGAGFKTAGAPTLYCHRAAFYHWRGASYSEISERALRSRIYAFLAGCTAAGKDGPRAVKPDRGLVEDVLHAMRAAAHLADEISAPAWLGDAADLAAGDIVACRNGLLYLATRELLPHTPEFFTLNALDFAYEAGAAEPVGWLRFLGDLFPDDPEAVCLLQEFFGYCVTADTSQQKALLIVGPKRSGKGTIAAVLTALVGADNVRNPTLGALGTRFGLQPLIGARLAIIADARLDGRADRAAVVEALLSIIGEDALTVDRKNVEAWTGRLQTRLLVLANELPKLGDPSGALASRFLLLKLVNSFYGREDLSLRNRLLGELPAILNWALDGRDRLRERGYFVPPASSADMVEQFEELGSGIAAFLRDCCVLGPPARAACRELFAAWRGWCCENGHDRPGSVQAFGRELRAAVPSLRQVRPRDGGDRARHYENVGLSDAGLSMMRAVRDGAQLSFAEEASRNV